MYGVKRNNWPGRARKETAGSSPSAESSFVLVPNSAIQEQAGYFASEVAIDSFLGPVAREFDRVIITSFVSIDKGGSWGKARPYRGVQALCLGRVRGSDRFFTKMWKYLCAIPRIIYISFKEPFLYVFVPGHVSLLFLILAVTFRRRFAIYLRGDWDCGTPAPLRFLKSHILSRAAFVLTAGEAALAPVSKYNRRCEAVVPMVRVTPSDLQVERDYSVDGDFNILFVGEIVASKGIFDLLDAFAAIAQRNPRPFLSIVGEGSHRGRLEEEIEKRRLLTRIKLHGFIQEIDPLRDIYSSADMFVLPTYHEGFPRVLYEAMTFGLPIITTNVGTIGGLMRDRCNCVFTKVGDTQDLRQKVCELIADGTLRERIGRAGVLTMRNFFDKRPYENHGSQFVYWFRACNSTS